jgi:prolycopene isomerase
MSADTKQDVVIIGAGIAGLVAGNYLAKAGLKVLILEHHYVVGGCCSSFKRKGFTFDCAAHSLGSCRPGGQFDRVLNELGLAGKMEIHRCDPSDTVITRERRVDLGGSADEMAEAMAAHFPQERNSLRAFFNELEAFDINQLKTVLVYYSKYKSCTFRDMLNGFFKDDALKSLISPPLGNLGLSSDNIGALPAISMFKEFVLDGGYYVTGGMQKFVDRLAENFTRLGGRLALRQKVTRIVVSGGRVTGVETERGGFLEAEHVISTAGPQQTYFRLIGEEWLTDELAARVGALRSSISLIVICLGLKGARIDPHGWGRTVWYVPNANSDEIYSKTFRGELDSTAEALLLAIPSRHDRTIVPPDGEYVYLSTVAPARDTAFWQENKAALFERILDRAEELLPGLRANIVVKEMATPPTISRYTLNDDGAAFGLACTPDQFKIDVMPQQTTFGGLYLASHWTTVGAGQGGTPMAAYAGRNVSRMILSGLEKRATRRAAPSLQGARP